MFCSLPRCYVLKEITSYINTLVIYFLCCFCLSTILPYKGRTKELFLDSLEYDMNILYLTSVPSCEVLACIQAQFERDNAIKITVNIKLFPIPGKTQLFFNTFSQTQFSAFVWQNTTLHLPLDNNGKLRDHDCPAFRCASPLLILSDFDQRAC